MIFKGRKTQITGQIGEYLVAAELCRLGFFSTTFTANVPHYDIIASDEKGRHLPVQVKAINKGTWQLNISHFCEIEFNDNTQKIIGPKSEPVSNLIVVLVEIKKYGSDRFYVLTWKEFRDILIKGHGEYLSQNKGRRPKNPASTHTAISSDKLGQFESNWDIVVNFFK